MDKINEHLKGIGVVFGNLPQELQDKITGKLFEHLRRKGYSFEDMTKLSNDEIVNIINELTRDPSFLGGMVTGAAVDHISDEDKRLTLQEHRKKKQGLFQTSEDYVKDLKSQMKDDKTCNDLIKSASTDLNEYRNKLKSFRKTVQELDAQFKKYLREIEDSLQFVETDRKNMYRYVEVFSHSYDVWGKDMSRIHNGISESLDSIDMINSFLPAILIEREISRREESGELPKQ